MGASRRGRASGRVATQTAVLLPAHEYQAGAGDCACSDGSHVPCAVPECGASEHAFVHTEEAREQHYTRVVEAVDSVGVADALS
jgi:hypothetical protein